MPLCFFQNRINFKIIIVEEIIERVFGLCVYIIQLIGGGTTTGYYIANLVIFVIIQPGLIVLFYRLWQKEKRKSKSLIK